MRFSVRDILNKLKWHHDFDLDPAQITYRHRGAPGDIKVIHGWSITDIGRSFFKHDESGFETSIPYHRVLKIAVDGDILFDRSRVGDEVFDEIDDEDEGQDETGGDGGDEAAAAGHDDPGAVAADGESAVAADGERENEAEAEAADTDLASS